MTDRPITGSITYTAGSSDTVTLDTTLTFVGAQVNAVDSGSSEVTLNIAAGADLIGSVTFFNNQPNGTDLVNSGTLDSNRPGQAVAIDTQDFANHGTIVAEDAATLTIAPALSDAFSPSTGQFELAADPWTNSSTITGDEANLQLENSFTNFGSITTTGGGLHLGLSPIFSEFTGTWRNDGTITTSGTAVELSGQVTTAGIGNLDRTGGSITLVNGTIDNTGAVIDVSGGNFEGLAINGTIENGTLISGPDGVLAGTNGILQNVTVLGGLTLGEVDSIEVEGLTLVENRAGNATAPVTLVGNGSLVIFGNSEITDAASVTALPPGVATVLDASGITLGGGSIETAAPFSPGVVLPPITLTIEPGFRIDGTGIVGGNFRGVSSTTLIQNDGVIDADQPGGTLAIGPVKFANSGSLIAENGGILEIGESNGGQAANSVNLAAAGTVTATGGSTVELFGDFVNHGKVSVTDGTLDLGNATNAWSNPGTITAIDSAIVLNGDTTTADILNIARTGGTITLGGNGFGNTIDNTGNTIDTNSGVFAGLVLDGGTIKGGTLKTGPGGTLNIEGQTTLDGVTVEGGLFFDGYQGQTGSLTLTDGTRIEDGSGNPAPITVTVFGQLNFKSLGALANDLTLDDGSVFDNTGPLTIAAGITVSGSGILNGGSNSTSHLDNQGTIDVTGGSLDIVGFGGGFSPSAPLPITNEGLIEIDAGATLSLNQAITAGTKAGSIDIGDHATFILGGTIASSADQTITFTGRDGTLVIGNDFRARFGTGLGATIVGFGAGDTIELFGATAATSVSFVGGTLTVSGSGSPYSFQLSGNYANDTFGLSSTPAAFTGELATTFVTVSPNPPAAGDQWNGTTGDWQDAGAWSAGIPGAGTNAVIGAGGSYTLTLAAGETDAVDNLTLDSAGATLAIAAGATLDVAGTLTVEAGTLAIDGTISGGRLDPVGGTVVFDGGTLSGVTVAGDLTIDGAATISGGSVSGTLTISTPPTGLQSSLDLTAAGPVSTDHSVTLAGGTLFATDTTAGQSPSFFRIGAEETIQGSGSIGGNLFGTGATNPDNINNFGTISANAAFTFLEIDPAEFINFGTLTAQNGATLDVSVDSWTNSGTISAETGATLELDGTLFNYGTITTTGGTLELGDPLGGQSSTSLITETGGTITTNGTAIDLEYSSITTATAESIQRTGGSVSLFGTIDNTDATIDTTSGFFAGLGLSDGTISGGTLIDGPGGALTFGNFGSGSGTLDNVAVEGGLIQNGGTLALTDGTTVSGLISVNGGTLTLDTATDLVNNVDLVNNRFGNGGTLTLGQTKIDAGITVQGSGTIGGATVTNAGTIIANQESSNGGTLTLTIAPQEFTNQGTVEAADGAILAVEYQPNASPPALNQWTNTAAATITAIDSTIELGGDFTNFGTITMVGGSLYLGEAGSHWTNHGTITTVDTAIYLGGNVAHDLGDIDATGGTLNLVGTLANTNNTIVTTTLPYSNLILAGGTITGGILKTGDDGFLNVQNSVGTLQGVHVEGGLLIGDTTDDFSFSDLVLTDDTTVTDTGDTTPALITVVDSLLELRSYAALVNDVTLAGGTLEFTQRAPGGGGEGAAIVADSMTPAPSPAASPPVLTIEAGVVIQGSGQVEDGGSFFGTQGTVTLVNEGTIDANVPATYSSTLTISTQSFSNLGTVEAQYGGSLIIEPELTFSSIAAGTFSNLSGTTLTGGTYVVDAQSRLQIDYVGAVVTNDATITLSGDNFLSFDNEYSSHFFSTLSQNNFVSLEQSLNTVGSEGTLNLLDDYTFITPNQITIDGTVVIGGGTLSTVGMNVNSTGVLKGFGTVTASPYSVGNFGLIEAIGGTLDIVTGVSGDGNGIAGPVQLAIGSPGAVLEIEDATSQTFSFNGVLGTFELTDAADFGGAILDFRRGDVLDLVGTQLSNPVYDAATDTLSVTDGTQPLQFATVLAAGETGTFTVANNDEIILSPSTSSPQAPATVTINTTLPIDFGIVHVKDSVDEFLSITNSAQPPADGLNATVESSTGVTATGSITNLAPGGTSANAIDVAINTNSAGAVSGAVTLDFSSTTGGSPPSIGSTTFDVSAIVDNYAQPAFEQRAVPGTPPQGLIKNSPTSYTFNFGDIPQFAPPATADFAAANIAEAPADTLGGSFVVGPVEGFPPAGQGPNSLFALTGFNSFIGIDPGEADNNPSVQVNTNTAGTFSETITLDPVGYNSSGFFGPLSPVTLTLVADIIQAPPSPPEAEVTPNPIVFAPLHALSPGPPFPRTDQPQQRVPLTVTNTGDENSANINGFALNATGMATIAGSVTGIAPKDSATGIDATIPDSALQNAAPGTFDGTVSVGLQAQFGNGTVSPLPNQDIPYSGVVYGYADPVLDSPYSSTDIPASPETADIGDFLPSDPPVDFTVDLSNLGDPMFTDMLSGGFTMSPGPGFSNDGFDSVDSIAGGGSVSPVGEIEFDPSGLSPGTYLDTITFEPINTSKVAGFSGALPELTVIFEAVVGPPPPPSPPPPPPPGQTWGDVHIVSFTGALYNFQAAGEFILARSTDPNNSFQIQGRFQPRFNGSSVTVMTAIAAEVGSDRISLTIGQADEVLVNGEPSTLTTANPTLHLSGGTVTLLPDGVYRIDWNTGETAQITDEGSFFNVSIGPGPHDAGKVQGLLGPDTTSADTFELPDGTVLPQPIPTATLYGEFADAWRITQTNSLFTYSPGQSTATFTDKNFPTDVVSLSDLPSPAVAQAQALVAAAGITDPAIALAAELDFLATGDPRFIDAAAQTQQLHGPTVAVTVSPPSPQPPLLGLQPVAPSVVAAASGTTAVDFEIYLSKKVAGPVTVDYAVIAPDAGDFGATAFPGGVLPSGTATIHTGDTSADIEIDLPAGALGTNPTGTLALQISNPTGVAGIAVFDPTSQVQIVNSQPVAGAPAMPVLAELTNYGTFTHTANGAYTLVIGTVPQSATPPVIQFALGNIASPSADEITGLFSASGTGFTVSGLTLPSAISGGQSYSGITVSQQANATGLGSETITFKPHDVNPTGFDAALSPIVLTITEAVEGPAKGAVGTSSPIAFGNVHVGATPTRTVSVTNAATQPAADLDATPTASGGATATGAITLLTPGSTDATDISVGIDTRTAGAKNGIVTLDFTSDSGDGNIAALPDSRPLFVSGAVFREAAAAVSSLNGIIHVHDSGTSALTVKNIAAADGFSEDLVASVAGFTGAVTASGSSGEIAAGGSSNTILVGVSTNAAGTETGTVTLALTSDGGTGAGSIDGLGTTILGSQTIGVDVIVNNYANPAFETLSGGGTLSRVGNSFTLDLGTQAQGSGPVVIDLGVLNDVTGPADTLSGTLSATGSAGFTAAGLADFAGLGAGQADTAPTVTLDTSAAGTETETITLTPTGSNASGFSGTLSTETLTIVAKVAAEPPPTISAPTSISTFQNVTLAVGPVIITDTADDGEPLTVTISDGGGILTVHAAGGVVVSGNDNDLVLTGDLDDLNATLASLGYTAVQKTGSDAISLSVVDGHHASTSDQIAVSTQPVPFTAPILNAPAQELFIPNVPTGVGGLQIVDPFAEATASPITVTFQSSDPFAQLTLTGNSGATVTGENTDKISITGTVDQINDYLSDGLVEFVVGQLGNFESLIGASGISISGTLIAKDPEGLVSAAGGPEGKFFQVGVLAASYAINGLLSLLPGNPPVSEAKFYAELQKILAGYPHIVTLDGLAYDLEAAGEFFLTGSTQTSDSFTVEVRLQPYQNSQSVSVMTEVAALLGTDRVTVGIDRADPIWVNGAPELLTVGETVALSGGQITQVSADSYQLIWNTGEVLGITDHGAYLDVGVGLASGDAPGTLAGLMGPDTGQANDFTLPDGTVLPEGALTAADLTEFVNAWRVTQATSLFDYSPGQSTATFTDPNFPQDAVTLNELPASVVAKAAAVVAAAGITDPTAMAAAEFDYIASGGNADVVASDASEYQGVASTPANVSPSGPVAAVVGVIADQPRVITPATGPTEVTFDVYLTAAEASDTIVDYQVVAPDGTDLDAEAFGGTLPSGQVTLAAGSTSGQFTIAVPQGALGTNANELLKVAISAPGGVPIFVSTAQAEIIQPLPGPPPLPVLSDLTTFGTFGGAGKHYTLDLGAIQAGQPVPTLQFQIANTAANGADDLAGSFSVQPVEGFSVLGDSLPSPLAPDQSYSGLQVVIDEMKFGANTETITFVPEDVNATGFSAPLSPITLDVSYTLEQQSMVYSSAWGDVHIITYNGLVYNFQAVGEFTLAKSRLPDDSFDIQLRLQPLGGGAVVSVITEVAVSVGSDKITFDVARPNNVVWIDGAPSSISASDPTVTFADGSKLKQLDSSTWEVDWVTGETATITEIGTSLFNVVDGVPVAEPGFVGGLQGEDEGASNDFQLADGTVLPQPLSTATLYGPFADSWRVSPATTLFDYTGNQDTKDFTDRNFPGDVVQLTDLPSPAVAAAAALVAAAGITDPGIAAATEFDYLATGNPIFIAAGKNAADQGTTTVPVVLTSPPAAPALGVSADKASVTELANSPTAVIFDIYLTAAAQTATTVDYAVVDPGPGDLGATAFNGTLPSGTISLAAGAISAQVTIEVPENALQSDPSDEVELQISSPPGGPTLFATTAQTKIVNDQQIAGNPPVPQLTDLSAGGTFSFDAGSNTYTLDLGIVPQGALLPIVQFSLANIASVPADNLGGTFTVPLGSGFLVSGANLPSPIGAGQSYSALDVTVQTQTPGAHSETFSFNPTDVNDTGFAAALPNDAFNLVIEDIVGAAAQATLNTPDMVIFTNVRKGTVESQAISVTNSAVAPAADLDVTGTATDAATTTGKISQLAPGATDTTSIAVGLDTSQLGPLTGVVNLGLDSDSGTGTTAPILPGLVIDVFGSVFQEASAQIAPISEIVHVKDPGTAVLHVANTDTVPHFSEDLIASLAAVTGAVTIASSGPTGDIAEGTSDNSTLAIGFSTTAAGVDTGNVTVALVSDGGIGPTSIDGLGQIALSPAMVPVSVTVNNFAVAGLADTNNAGTFISNGNNTYTLDLGTIATGTAPVVIDLAALNLASGPADLLAGDFSTSGDGEFTNSLAMFSGLGAGGSSGVGTVTLSTGKAGTFEEIVTLDGTGSNASGYSGSVAPVTLTIEGTVTGSPPAFNLAAASIAPASLIALGNTRINGSLSQALTITNTGSPPAEALDASIGGTTPAASASGSITLLADGASDSSHIVVGLDTKTAGAKTGTVTIDFASDGATTDGNGATPLSPQTVALTGAVYREASATVTGPASPLIVHVNDTVALPLTITNTAATDGFSEDLIATAETTGSGGVTATGSTGDIAPGASDGSALTVSFDTKQAGTIAGGVTLALQSDGGQGPNSIDGLGTIGLASVVVPIDATIDNYAAGGFAETAGGGNFAADGSNAAQGANYQLDLGTVQFGASPVVVSLAALNIAAAPADALSGSFTTGGSAAFDNALIGSFADLAAGGSDAIGTVTLDTTTAGTFTETITLVGTGSNASGYSQAVANATLTIEGIVNTPPSIVAPVSVTVQQGQPSPVGGVVISDVDATSGDETITVTVSDGRGDLAANTGAPGGGGTINGSGGTALTLVGTLAEINADLTTLTDTDSASTADTITVTAADGRGGTATPATILVGHTFALTKTADTITGDPGNDLITAAAGTPTAGDTIDGAGGTNTLELVGAGSFNFAAPTTIANIQNIIMQEGQAGYAIGGQTYAAQNQIVNLRTGLNGATITVLADPTYNPLNPNVAAITIIANNNNDTIDLPTGTTPAVTNSIATLTVGSVQQTVNLGSGNNVVMVTGVTIGATIGNGTGNDTLQVTGGGTVVMGSNITDIPKVQLSAAATAYNFTANTIDGLVINDTSTTADTVQAGGADQTITGGAAGKLTMLGSAVGGDTFKDTAALLNNDKIGGFAAPGDVIDLTDLVYGTGVIKSFSENTGNTAATLVVSDGTHSANLTLLGQFANAFVAAPDSGGGTQITYQPTPQELTLLAHH